MSKSYKGSTIKRERGIALIYYLTALATIIFFGYVAIRFGKINRDRVTLQSNVRSALNAGIMAAPGGQDIFFATCNHLKSLWIPSLPCASTDFAPWPPPSPITPSVATYSGSYPSTNGEYACSGIQMTYTPANPPTVPQSNFCLNITCTDQSLVLASSSIRRISTSSCIGAQPVVGYLAIDYSTSLYDTFSDYSSNFAQTLGPRSVSVTPPSFAVLGNDNYFSNSSVPVQGGHNQSGTPQAILSQMIDMQLPGIRQRIDSNGNLTTPVRMPFIWSEIDRVGEQSLSALIDSGTGTFNTTDVNNYLNDDSLNPNIWLSMPAVPRPGSSPDNKPDPIQYISDNPKLGVDSSYLGIQSTMRDWLSAGKCEESDSSGCNLMHSFTRGGHATQNYLANQCYGSFITIYKQAAEQVLYLFGKYKIRTGVMGFSNWVYPILPLFPESFFTTVGSPLYNRAVSDNEVKVLGPTPASLPTPAIVPNNDFVLSQYGDTFKSGGYRLNRNRASQVLNPMSYCFRDTSFEVVPGGPKYFTALPNTENPTMLVDSNRAPDQLSPCPLSAQIEYYDNPMVYGRDARCNQPMLGGFPFDGHFDAGNLVCSYRAMANDADDDALEPSWAFPNYGVTGTNIQNQDIKFPWRWCNTETLRPNIAVGIHSIAAGQFSKIGIERSGIAASFDPSLGPLNDPDYPAETFNESSTFTPGALLIAIRALLDPALAPPGTRKILVVFTDGVPTTGIYNRINSGTWFPRNPTPSEVPQYGSGTPTLSGMLETAHLLQYAASQGITVYLQMVASGSEGAYKDGMLAMLHPPNIQADSGSGAYAYNFCKSPALQNLAQSLTGNMNRLPGEADFPASSTQNCNPTSTAYTNGINVLDVTKLPTETYDQFRQRVFSQLGAQLLYEISQWKHTK